MKKKMKEKNEKMKQKRKEKSHVLIQMEGQAAEEPRRKKRWVGLQEARIELDLRDRRREKKEEKPGSPR